MISVIIPVFNGENFIERAVLSVIKQTYCDIELIVVNDGSTDRTQQILESLWKQYKPKGKLITINNSGSSHARNVGLDNISGEYFCLLDADDYLEITIFENIFKKFKNFDVCYYGYRDIDENGLVVMKYDDVFHYIDNISGPDSAILKLKKKIWMCHGNAVFSRQILEDNKIRYIDGINHGEDLYFIIMMLASSNVVRCLDVIGENITVRSSSVMHSEYNSSFLGSIVSIDYMKKNILRINNACQNKELLELIDKEKMEQICYVAKKVISSKNLSFVDKYKSISKASNNGFKFLFCVKHRVSLSKFIEYFLLRNSITLYIMSVTFYTSARTLKVKFKNYFRKDKSCL